MQDLANEVERLVKSSNTYLKKKVNLWYNCKSCDFGFHPAYEVVASGNKVLTLRNAIHIKTGKHLSDLSLYNDLSPVRNTKSESIAK